MMTHAADPPPAESGGPPAIDWEAYLAMHQRWLRKVIFARTSEPEAVEEVFQEVAVAALEQKSPLANPSKAAPWLHRLAVVHSARYRRGHGRRRNAIRRAVELHHLGNGHAEDVLAWLVNKELEERTRLALRRLAGRDAEILLLKYGERWTYREIAERLGISEKAIDSRLVRARARLRHQLLKLGIHEHE